MNWVQQEKLCKFYYSPCLFANRKFKLASNQEERGMMEGIVPRISCP